jgi:hypothetical protein
MRWWTRWRLGFFLNQNFFLDMFSFRSFELNFWFFVKKTNDSSGPPKHEGVIYFFRSELEYF